MTEIGATREYLVQRLDLVRLRNSLWSKCELAAWLGTPDGEAAVIEAMRKLNYNVRRRFIRALQAETRSASRDGGTAWTPLYMTPDAVCIAAAAALREGNDG